MKPYLVDEIRSADLDVIKPVEPKVLIPRPSRPRWPASCTEMMVAVVDNGTGTNAQIPGIEVAGKTGTAQSRPSRPPYAWFVSFAPAEDARVAVAVLIQDAGVERERDLRWRPGGADREASDGSGAEPVTELPDHPDVVRHGSQPPS